ncbi:MAG: exo-alpha-sialidase [Chthonomonadales bacterium]|nr:exo-alpha-sialidase [Chthonomonadales bacterium]
MRADDGLAEAAAMAASAPAAGGPVRPLASAFVTLFESPDPDRVFCYTPGLARLGSGRLVATLDLGGPGVADLPGIRLQRGDGGNPSQGKVLTSDDGGLHWTHRADFPFYHARPFAAGRSLYVLGHAGDLRIMRSDDEGVTWSASAALTRGQEWHQSACNVHYAGGCVYLVMERRVSHQIRAWAVGELAPVLMRARVDDDLTRRESWTFASELSFGQALAGAAEGPEVDYFGVPFHRAPYPAGAEAAPGRRCAPMGWLETNVVQIVDRDHAWFAPGTFHLWMRAHTGGTGYAAVAKVLESADGSMATMLETVPSGKRILYAPCPGGQMRFHVLYDAESRLYWLLSSQATDSMTRADRLPPERFNLPNNERHRLQLHFSRNMVDWCFAGIVAVGGGPRESRHYASMVVDGEDLVVLSRSGDARARSAHDGNLITFHRIPRFRDLVY